MRIFIERKTEIETQSGPNYSETHARQVSNIQQFRNKQNKIGSHSASGSRCFNSLHPQWSIWKIIEDWVSGLAASLFYACTIMPKVPLMSSSNYLLVDLTPVPTNRVPNLCSTQTTVKPNMAKAFQFPDHDSVYENVFFNCSGPVICQHFSPSSSMLFFEPFSRI